MHDPCNLICVLVLTISYGDCDGSTATGCELDIMVTPAHCGACGNVCAEETPTCSGGVCMYV